MTFGKSVGFSSGFISQTTVALVKLSHSERAKNSDFWLKPALCLWLLCCVGSLARFCPTDSLHWGACSAGAGGIRGGLEGVGGRQCLAPS